MKAPSPLRPHGLPNSPDGVQKIPIGVTTTPNTLTFQSQMCGVAFGIETMSIAQALVSKFHMMSCNLITPLVRSDKYFVSFSTCNPTACSHWLTQSQKEADIYYLFIIG